MSYVNSLAPGKFAWNFRTVIFKQILVIDGWGISCEIALIWMSLDFTDDQSTLVQVMAWCRQAASHYLSQCWPRSLSPYGVTRPQWVKVLAMSHSIWGHGVFLESSSGMYSHFRIILPWKYVLFCIKCQMGLEWWFYDTRRSFFAIKNWSRFFYIRNSWSHCQ